MAIVGAPFLPPLRQFPGNGAPPYTPPFVDRTELEQRTRDVEERFGPWTAHNIQLADGLFTIGPGAGNHQRARLGRVTTLVESLARRPISELRVLDLGALEGLFAVELALRGATVTAVEGRLANVEKIRLARDALGLDRLEVRHEDVRALAPGTLGEYDVVLALEILMLDAPDAFDLLDRVSAMCTDLLVVESEVAAAPDTATVHRGRTYFGSRAPGDLGTGDPGRPEARWAALGNRRWFRFSGPSLANALAAAGFPVVLECRLPTLPAAPTTVTYAALRRDPPPELLAPPPTPTDGPAAAGPLFLPDRRPRPAALAARAREVARTAVPAPVRRLLRRPRYSSSR